MSPKVTVVIPVYNVEKYLSRCVDSVLNQTLTDLEIILVDDGSPDSCPSICDVYAKTDHRIRVVHKQNGGLSSARNAGMKIASGEYLFFLDSDDWLEPDGLQHLWELANHYQVDYVRYRAFRTGWPDLPENAPCMVEPVREMPGGLYDRERIVKSLFPRLLATSQLTLGPVVGAWGSLYRRSFLEENQLMFYEDIRFSEDILFSANVIRCTKSFYYDDNAGVYHYYYNEASISKSFRAERWDSVRHLIARAREDFEENKEFDFSRQLDWLTWFCIMLGLGERKKLPDRKERQQYCKGILTDPVVKNCPLRKEEFDVSKKQLLMMRMVKCGFWWIIADI